MLNGKKTYLLAFATVAYAALGWWLGQTSLNDALQLALPVLGAAFLRHGVSTTAR